MKKEKLLSCNLSYFLAAIALETIEILSLIALFAIVDYSNSGSRIIWIAKCGPGNWRRLSLHVKIDFHFLEYDKKIVEVF